MVRSKIAGIGMYVPNQVFTNYDLMKYMDTSDEWIQERTGIKERRFADRTKETTTTMAIEASKIAIERAGITAQDIDFSFEGDERMKCRYDGEDLAIAFNAKFLIEMLSAADSDDIKIELSTPTKAGIIKPTEQEDNEELMMLVMPLMLNQ